MKFSWTRQDTKEHQLLLFGLFILLALVLSAWIISCGVVTFKKYDGEQITVTGTEVQTIKSDLASWTGTVARRANTMGQAYGLLQKDMAVLKRYLIQAGIPEKEIQVGSIVTDTLYSRSNNGESTNNVEGFDLSQSVTLESADVDKLEALSRDANTLLTRGLTLTSSAPQFFYTKLDSLKIDMLGKATQNAKARAESMARSTGNHIGLMRSAQMGVFQITDPNSTEVSDYGVNDTTSKTKKITAVVNVTFAIQ